MTIFIISVAFAALFTFAVCDRRAAFIRINQCLDRIESGLENDLMLQKKIEPRNLQLLDELRHLAKDNTEVAKILRQFSLL